MSFRFGDHSSDQGVVLDNGMYDATVDSASLVMENGVPKKNDNGKESVDVHFKIDEETKIKRRYAIGFGQNKANGQWAAFAKMLEAATGIRVGDSAQRDLTPDHLVGKRVRVIVEMNDRGYADIVNVMAVPKANGNGATTKAKPLPVGAAVGGSDSTPADDEIPY